eukprot:TRINITY_DN7645_c0_g1_i1.p1 TRINITY_DN7645_c0_g1~~TRINITY_DN7645_c0_g1_i1.p1  ORF type:complete len:365 (-),score=81.50 TRINITY_DN7645_c0_g1_i1:103-1197(-)
MNAQEKEFFSLVNMRDFDQVSQQYMQDPYYEIDDSAFDISVESILHYSPGDHIDKLIKEELSDANRYPVLPDGIKEDSGPILQRAQEVLPKYDDLAAARDNVDLNATKQRKIFTDKAKTRFKRKQVNYIELDKNRIDSLNEGEGERINPNDILLTVAFYHSTKEQKTQAYQVLGSQLLSDLVDRFYCLEDHILDGPNHKAGFFFIEGVFYSDRRNGNIDYADQILDWLNSPGRDAHLGNIVPKKLKMEESRFIDLALSINKRYVYRHQGDCEHIMVFEEVRRIKPNNGDVMVRSEYPLHVFQCKTRRKKCRICNIYPAKCVVYGDVLSPDNPTFYCDYCYRPFHYTLDGRLIRSDYQVFPYYHE